ncbi:hypothetical protein GUITHDRAFT_135219 [Guillardia theta CCMP2712]|uniref:Poly(A) RNA polymerase mitochondrial-like central palm domain-containing protein n=1 Tax=Guillardia theta (strain CCMP2712) TaxID=905079 RepID=L1JQ41_GUITC|nr:hypothetical protein GUITHDRAFT_135219 [Guillardia theta CCMP2712]EKX50587.1 hypothetical protein GUITHDRAFT_135219 [Guillardia theta CCMP2712]|eukprot:XP_005837567.1 hypothetical protein GUITHDRAFT_135219 [Guillardia theta CCMP2712]
MELHNEILDFVAFIKASQVEKLIEREQEEELKQEERTRMRKKKRRERQQGDRARRESDEVVTHEIWPEAELKVFGSYATGMFLPSSDVDMVVVNCSDCDPLVKLAKVLKSDGNFDKIQVIGKAKVPIIKFEDVPSGIPLNICFGQEDGLINTEWVKFLYNRDLHETYTGGREEEREEGGARSEEAH